MLYKIVKITDRQGNDKLHDKEAVSRIGRVIDDVQSSIDVGCRGIFFCVWPTALKTMITTKIKSITNDGTIMIVETVNSFYYLKKIKELGE